MQGMKSLELCRRLAITPRQLQWWCDHQLVQLGVANGRLRDFDDRQALKAGMIAALRGKGVSLRAIKGLKLSPIASDYLVTDTRTALYCDNAETVVLCAAFAPRGVYVIDLADLRRRLNGSNAGEPRRRTKVFVDDSRKRGRGRPAISV